MASGTSDSPRRGSVHYAHTLPGRPETEWEPLRDHLEAVADRAEEFAGAFGAAEWGRLAGLWHDLGKYRPEFQAYLRGEAGASSTRG